MGLLSHRPSKNDKVVARIILILWLLFCVYEVAGLVSENRYYNATGWIIILAVYGFFLIWTFYKPRETRMSYTSLKKVLPTGNDELVLLHSSKDIIRICQIEQALKGRDIFFTVLDRYGSTMMEFLPEVEMRIMVLKKDFRWSNEIIDELIKEGMIGGDE